MEKVTSYGETQRRSVNRENPVTELTSTEPGKRKQETKEDAMNTNHTWLSQESVTTQAMDGDASGTCATKMAEFCVNDISS